MSDPTINPWTTWGGDTIVLVGLIYLQVLYLVGVGPVRKRFKLAPKFPTRQAVIFTSAVVLLFLSLQSPLHTLGDGYLFSAHMVQHLMLTLVCAPMLLIGTPSWLVRPLLRVRPAAAVLKMVTNWLPAFLVYNFILVFSHLPALYDFALRNETAHSIQHMAYLGTAILVWWSICGPLPELNRLPPPGQMLLLFGSTLPAFATGAMLAYSVDAVYPTYVAAPRVFDWLSPVEDQRLGGLIMWIIGSLYYLIIMGVVFFSWFNREEEKTHLAGLGQRPQ